MRKLSRSFTKGSTVPLKYLILVIAGFRYWEKKNWCDRFKFSSYRCCFSEIIVKEGGIFSFKYFLTIKYCRKVSGMFQYLMLVSDQYVNDTHLSKRKYAGDQIPTVKNYMGILKYRRKRLPSCRKTEYKNGREYKRNNIYHSTIFRIISML